MVGGGGVGGGGDGGGDRGRDDVVAVVAVIVVRPVSGAIEHTEQLEPHTAAPGLITIRQVHTKPLGVGF